MKQDLKVVIPASADADTDELALREARARAGAMSEDFELQQKSYKTLTEMHELVEAGLGNELIFSILDNNLAAHYYEFEVEWRNMDG